MGASDITMCLKRCDPVTFGQISRNTIEGWIEGTHAGRTRSFNESRMEIILVMTKVVAGEYWYVLKASIQQKVDSFQSRHPDVVESIKKHLMFL
jgi:hypothetical protein